MTTASRTTSHSAARTAFLLIAAVLVAVGLNAIVAMSAAAAGAPDHYGPLTVPAYASMTAIGVIAGWFGWMIIRSRSRNPRRTLAVLVPVVAVVSFAPDVILVATGFVPGTTMIAVIALMIMHIVTIGVAVPCYILASRRQSEK